MDASSSSDEKLWLGSSADTYVTQTGTDEMKSTKVMNPQRNSNI